MLGVEVQLIPEDEGVVDGFAGLAFGAVRGLFGLKFESDALEDGIARFLTDGRSGRARDIGIRLRNVESLVKL